MFSSLTPRPHFPSFLVTLSTGYLFVFTFEAFSGLRLP